MNNQNSAAHDLGTSAGGRAYIAEYFATQLRRHDFARYIENSLAADFACALSQHLSKLRAPVADERAAFEAARQKRDADARLGRMCLVNNDEYSNSEDQAAWEGWQDRAALASAPVAGEAVGKVVLFGGDLKEVSWAAGKMPPPGTTLYTTPQASESVRDSALEEAAVVAESSYGFAYVPHRIRALKSQSPALSAQPEQS